MRAAIAAPARLLAPEGAVLAALLALPWFPDIFRHVEPRAVPLLATVTAAGFALAWRFARGRPVHGLLVLAAAAALPLLPEAAPATRLAELLVPLNLAVIALLPDRGILTRGGVLRTTVVLAQALVLAAVAVLRPAGADPFDPLRVETLGIALAPATLVYGAALLTLAVTASITGAAPARGAFWATAAALLARIGYPGGSAYLLAAAGIVLVVAMVEDAYALAYRDALTGLPSRRALDELLDRTARRFTVAMIDVDHFKAVNDRHGHDVGDQVLRLVATKLRETGGGGRAFRYGGEEFTLVFRGRRLEDVTPHLDAVREAVASADFVVRAPDRPKKKPRRIIPARGPRKKLSVTVSIGAAERPNGSGAPADVLKAADAALYRAKQAGRNQVVAARR